MGNSKFKPVLGISVISGGRPEGSKHNLKFQSAIGIISNTFKVKIFFFLLPFFHSTWIILS